MQEIEIRELLDTDGFPFLDINIKYQHNVHMKNKHMYETIFRHKQSEYMFLEMCGALCDKAESIVDDYYFIDRGEHLSNICSYYEIQKSIPNFIDRHIDVNIYFSDGIGDGVIHLYIPFSVLFGDTESKIKKLTYLTNLELKHKADVEIEKELKELARLKEKYEK